jgi:hypothetical protein
VSLDAGDESPAYLKTELCVALSLYGRLADVALTYWRTIFSTTERSLSPWLVISPTNFSKRLNML